MTHIVISNGLTPPPDEAGTAMTVRYVERLPGRVLLVNRARASYSLPGVRMIRVPTGSNLVAKALSRLVFVLVSLCTVVVHRGHVHYFPLRPPGLADQVHGLALSALSSQFDEVLFQLRRMTGLSRFVSRFPIRVTSELDRRRLAAAGLCVTRFEGAISPPDRPDYDCAALRSWLGVREGAFVASHVGHFSAARGIDFLLRLAELKPEIDVVLVFSSRMPVALPTPPSNCVVIDRFVPDVQQIYAISDAYVFPIRSERAAVSTPLTLVEARHAGLPIVCSGLPHLRETLQGYDRVCFVDMAQEERALSLASTYIDDLSAGCG